MDGWMDCRQWRKVGECFYFLFLFECCGINHNFLKRKKQTETPPVESHWCRANEVFTDPTLITVRSPLQEIAARVNQSALEAVTPSPSFQQRHESMRPGRSVLGKRSTWPRRCFAFHFLLAALTTLPVPLAPAKGAWAERAASARWARSRRPPSPCSRWTPWWPQRTPSSSTSSPPSARRARARARRPRSRAGTKEKRRLVWFKW